MANISTIKGFTIQSFATDPYTTEVAAGTWASANALNTGRAQAGAAGIQTAASIFGGTPALTATEKYDGTSWTTSPATLNTGRKELSGVGTQDAAIAFGGDPAVTATEVFNGTTWTTSPGTLNTGRKNISSFGISTAAVAAQGNTPPNTANVEEWDGTSWSEETNAPESNGQGAGCGILTAGLIFGGYITAATANTFAYDGTSWAAGGGLNTARWNLNGWGTQTAGMAFGGGDPSPVIGGYTENYNGSAWTEVADAATKRETSSGVGTAPAGLVMGGSPVLTTTEEFAAPATTSVAQEGQVWYNSTDRVLKGNVSGFIGAGTWSSGTNMNEGRPGISGAGTQTAAFGTGGGPSIPGKQLCELYDGTTWTEVGNLQTATTYASSAGSTTAGLNFGGPGTTSQTESWDGTSWSVETGALQSGRGTAAGFGSQTAAMMAGGNPPLSALSETWDGTSWSEGNNINTARNYVKGSGTTTSGIIGPGAQYPAADTANTEEYDGTCWAQVDTVNTARSGYGMSKDGPNASALIFCGDEPSPSTTICEQYDGTSWTEVADVTTGTQELCGAGTGTVALKFGGNDPGGYTDSTEEFTTPSGPVNKTFTAT